jgi:hypothetical protein
MLKFLKIWTAQKWLKYTAKICQSLDARTKSCTRAHLFLNPCARGLQKIIRLRQLCAYLQILKIAQN